LDLENAMEQGRYKTMHVECLDQILEIRRIRGFQGAKKISELVYTTNGYVFIEERDTNSIPGPANVE
jgi:hypothetical protein